MDLWGACGGRVSVVSAAVDLKRDHSRWSGALGACFFLNLALFGGIRLFIDHLLFRTRNQLELHKLLR